MLCYAHRAVLLYLMYSPLLGMGSSELFLKFHFVFRVYSSAVGEG